MIKNERQYKVSRSKSASFERAIAELDGDPVRAKNQSILANAEREALAAQLEELQQDLHEYESLREGRTTVIQTFSLDDLPSALIKARIAARMTHKDLAAKLNISEQQVQMYESTNYASASLQRLSEVANALGLSVSKEYFLQSESVTGKQVMDRITDLGFEKSFAAKRLLPQHIGSRITDLTSKTQVLEAAQFAANILGLSTSALLSGRSPNSGLALAAVRHKLPKNADAKKVSAQTVYAHYLALLTLQATPKLQPRNVPEDTDVLHDQIIGKYGSISFETVLAFVWADLGIPVIPLKMRGGFHGASWRIHGRNILVLSPSYAYSAGWLNDLLHELGHTTQEPELEERSIVEFESITESRDDDPDEKDARLYAIDTTFRSRGEFLATECTRRAKSVENLKQVVLSVAEEFNVPSDSLALYLAYRMKSANWWGTANNLQDKASDPFKIAREKFISSVDLSVLSPNDRAVLIQSLTEEGV